MNRPASSLGLVAVLALSPLGLAAQQGAPTLDEITDALSGSQSGLDAEAAAAAAASTALAGEAAGEADPTSAEVAAATAETTPPDSTETPTPASIEAVTYEGGPLPSGRSSLTVRVQVLLDRAGISPGVIDGYRGGMSESAILAFETREGLPQDGELDAEVWAALGGDEPGAVLQSYVIRPEDLEGLTPGLPTDYAELARLDAMGHQRVTERLAEWFHMDEDFLKMINPDSAFAAGDEIVVAAFGGDLVETAARIEVQKSVGRLAAFDAEGRMIANYPVTVGSSSTPSPSGDVEVTAVAMMPTYHYSPENFVQGDNTEPLVLPPGPNGPVGSVWIDLSKPSYGLHGTPEPASLFSAQSHGCVRLTNWDAEELARMVSPGVPVSFIE